MLPYVARRLGEVVVAFFLIATLVFILMHFRVGGPCGFVPRGAAGGGLAAPPGYVDCADYFQLNQPVVSQYLAFLSNYAHGDLGLSLAPGATSVLTTVRTQLPTTLVLITSSFVLQQVIALPLGVLAAVRRYSWFDGAFSVASYGFLSVPAFVLGLGLMYVFAVDWGVLPCCRATTVDLPTLGTGAWFGLLWQRPPLVAGDALRHLILPATTLALVGIAVDSRFIRASMLQVLNQEYIRTARAKGVRHRAIVWKHAFRNALPPIITNMGLYLPALLGGAMVVETVFTYTGVGYSFTQAIVGGDIPLAQAIFVLSTAMVLLGNLAADVLYGLADPRIRYG